MTSSPASSAPPTDSVRYPGVPDSAAELERRLAAGAPELQLRDDVHVRLMRPDETDAVAALVERAYSIDFELNDGYRADIAAVGRRARQHQVWVATDAASGTLFGTVSTPVRGAAISPLARLGELDFRFLGVAAEARRRGIGELLVEHVLRLARIRGVDRVVLNTGPDMMAAQRLYVRLGFARLNEREYTFERPDGSSFLMLAYGRDVVSDGQVDITICVETGPGAANELAADEPGAA